MKNSAMSLRPTKFRNLWTILCIVSVNLCANANSLVSEFELEYNFNPPDKLVFKTKYDFFSLTFIKCGDLSSSPAINGILTLLNDPQPCRQYQCNVILRNNQSVDTFCNATITNGIGAVPPIKELHVEPSTNHISIKMSYAHIDCITSFYVLVDNTRAILYTSENITTNPLISDLSPCVNYHVVILLNYKYTQYVLFDSHVKTYADSYSSIQNVQYDPQTELLTWTQLGCPWTYDVTIKEANETVKTATYTLQTKRKNCHLSFLPKCLRYLVTVTPQDYQGLSNTIAIDVGYENRDLYAPGRVRHLKVDLITDSMLSIKWSRPATNPDCVSEYALQINNFWTTTKSLEYVVANYTRSEFVHISVCTKTKLPPQNCVNYVGDPVKIESLELQNVSKIEVRSNYNGKITTIRWNPASPRENGIKYYVVRIYDTSGREIYKNSVAACETEVTGLVPCEEYLFYIETIPAQNHTNKIESTLKFKANPQIPGVSNSPTLVSRTSSSLTMMNDYRNSRDKCEIEIYRFTCSTGSQVRVIDSDDRVTTLSNLLSDTKYNCSAMVKNEYGWSDPSTEETFETDLAKDYQRIELYAYKVTSNSIGLAWETTINSMFYLNITEIKPLDVVPAHCKSSLYYKFFAIRSENNREYKFTDLESNTNYSIQVETFDGLTNYISQIFVVTHPNVPHQVRNLQITSLTNQTVTISWEVPCILNGQIKHFAVAITATNESYIDEPVLYRIIPIHQLTYTETTIKPNSSYNISVAIKIKGFPGSLNESFIGFVSPAETTDSMLIVYIAILVALLILLLVVIFIMYYFYCFEPYEQSAGVTGTNYIELKNYSSSVKLADNELILKEFQSICDMDFGHLSKTVPQNQVNKNRNPNIIPYDFNRVVLKPNHYCFTDYINASYIDGFNDLKQYIATQGPTQDTVYDFWHMVIQEKCEKIVMLTQIVENGCNQCIQYYPNANEVLEFGDLIVKNVDETKFGNFIKRSLIILRGKMKRYFVHYQYTAWADLDSPENPLCLIEFIEVSGAQTNEFSNPIVVHSSAGAGRTGTYIALDILFQTCRSVDKVSISETIKKLRLQRCGMVQTFSQYEFLYAAIKSYYLTRVYKRNEWL